jgi:hypothetical protein
MCFVHITVILETYATEAFPYFVALMSVAVLQTDTERDPTRFILNRLFSRATISTDKIDHINIVLHNHAFRDEFLYLKYKSCLYPFYRSYFEAFLPNASAKQVPKSATSIPV